MASVSGQILRLLPLCAGIAWVVCSSLPSKDAALLQEQRQISYTRDCLETRLDLLKKLASEDKEPVSCREGLASAPLFDAWGRLARCSSATDQIAFTSSGPDEEFNSGDDIEVSISFNLPTNLSKNE